MPGHFRTGLNAGLAASLLFASFGNLSAAEISAEYQERAAFLLSFTKFVEWPPSAFATPESPLTICILGENPFDDVLEKITAGEVAQDRKIAVQQISRVPDPQACQLLFMGGSTANPAAVLGDESAGILTVGEAETFLRNGGMIKFFIENRRVRFDINLEMAEKAGLKLSSRLLGVARTVEK